MSLLKFSLLKWTNLILEKDKHIDIKQVITVNSVIKLITLILNITQVAEDLPHLLHIYGSS